MDLVALLPDLPHSVNADPLSVAHPAHRGFVETIGADLVVLDAPGLGSLDRTVLRDVLRGLTADTLPQGDVYLAVGPAPLFALPKLYASRDDPTVVLLAADFRFNGLASYGFSFPEDAPRYVDRLADSWLLKRLVSRYVDGVIAVSELMEETLSALVSGRTAIAHPYIQASTCERLADAAPTLDASRAITVCENRDHKGVDRLVAAWPRVRAAHPDATLEIVGENHPDAYESVPGVFVHGYVEDLLGILARSSVYVHPARFDAFPVSVLEAMRLGLPPIVTTATGTRSVVGPVDDALVVESRVAAIADGVRSYFDRTVESRQAVSEQVVERSAPFQRTSRLSAFETAFDGLVASI